MLLADLDMIPYSKKEKDRMANELDGVRKASICIRIYTSKSRKMIFSFSLM